MIDQSIKDILSLIGSEEFKRSINELESAIKDEADMILYHVEKIDVGIVEISKKFYAMAFAMSMYDEFDQSKEYSKKGAVAVSELRDRNYSLAMRIRNLIK